MKMEASSEECRVIRSSPNRRHLVARLRAHSNHPARQAEIMYL